MEIGQTIYLKPHFTEVKIIDFYNHESKNFIVVKGKQNTPYMREECCFATEVPRTVTIRFLHQRRGYCYFCPDDVSFEIGDYVLVGSHLQGSNLAEVIGVNQSPVRATKILHGHKIGVKF